MQVEEEPEDEPADDDAEDKEDDSEDKEEVVDEDEDEVSFTDTLLCCIRSSSFNILFLFIFFLNQWLIPRFPYRQKQTKMNCEALKRMRRQCCV